MSRFLFVYLIGWVVVFCHGACRILVPQQGIKLMPPAEEAQSLNHWQVLFVCFLFEEVGECIIGWMNRLFSERFCSEHC